MSSHTDHSHEHSAEHGNHAATTSSDSPLVFTDAAARKVSELITGEGNPT